MNKNICRLGNALFRVHRDWFELPEGVSLENVTDVAINTRDKIYVLQREQQFILIFSPEGDLEAIWESDDILDGHHLHIANDGRIFLADRDAHCIVFFSPSGEVIETIGKRNHPQGLGKPFNHPTSAVCSPEGELFVSDGYGNYSIHHFDSSGNLLRSWGKPGNGPGCFATPHSLLLDREKNLLVADRENNRIQIFNQKGCYLREIKNMFHPMAMMEYADNTILVTDQSQRIVAFDNDGEIIGSCRSFGMYAHGIAGDQNGNFYTAEMNPSWVTKFEKIDEI